MPVKKDSLMACVNEVEDAFESAVASAEYAIYKIGVTLLLVDKFL